MAKETLKHKRLRKQISKMFINKRYLKSHDIEKIKVALARGLNPNAELTPRCATLLEWASQMKWFEVVKLFVLAGADVNQYVHKVPLRRALPNDSIAIFLIDHGADVNYTDDDFFEKPIIHVLAEKNNDKFNKILWKRFIDAGVDVNAQDKYGKTALMCACESKNYKAVNFLMEHGADLTIKDPVGKTAADYIEPIDKESAAVINNLLNG